MRDRGAGLPRSSPGPTLRVQSGDDLAVRLINRLAEPNNLHTQGLRVSPQGNGDNPFLRTEPGTSFDYLFRIPRDHPAGTFWDHPHRHGHVTDQICGELAGAMLVDDGPDLLVAQARVVLVTDTTMTVDGVVARPDPMERMQGRESELVLVNGQHQPTLGATPGTAQRWRVINGCVFRALALRLAGHELDLVAQDGAFLPPKSQQRVVLAPGNPVDVLVRPRKPGRFPFCPSQ
ncbi:multicopper oxidase family protein [Salinifilum ghardaiensis]